MALKDNIKEIEKLRSSGKTYQEIATIFKVTAPAVYYVLKGQESKTNSKAVGRYLKSKRIQAIEILGNKCCKCGFDDIRALQIDHINGGGGKEIKSRGHYNMYKDIIETPLLSYSKYQLLCANCNWIKRYKNNEVRNGVKLI